MFTIKIETGETTSLRSWPDVIMHRKGCKTFEDLIEDERQKWNDSPGVLESIELYDCILVSTCGQFEFYKTINDAIYITNQNGKTVEILR